jgi:hypothetical protein
MLTLVEELADAADTKPPAWAYLILKREVDRAQKRSARK